MKKVCFDLLIHIPLIYFPSFYIMKDAIDLQSLKTKYAAESLRKYRENMLVDCRSAWILWGPTQILTFSIVPLHMRVPFVSSVNLLWTAILSALRGQLNSAGC